MPFAPLPALAPPPAEIRSVRLATPPVIDGRIDDAEWADVPVFSGTGFDEETGSPGSEMSEYRLAYDSKFIYFAARLTDSQPSKIRATEFRTNVNLRGDDFVGMYIDPFGTFSDVNTFDINPQGATNIRVNGGRAAKREWLGAMDAKSRITATGWETEARIPWSVMRLPGKGKRDIRVGFYRLISRSRRSYIHNNIANGQVANTPVWKDVEVPESGRDRAIKLLPYGYGGYEDRKGILANSGLDLKYGLTDDIDLIGSINPDFRNIENQVLSVDFSYFERLAGETRPFFLEGADYFRTSQDAPLFAPQRISAFDGGIKAYGKIGDRTQVATLHANDLGIEDDTVASIRQNFGPRTNVNIAGTRMARPGLENSASFIGAYHGWGPYEMYFQHQSTRDTLDGAGRRVNTGLGYQQDGLFANAEWVEVTDKFNPRLGFAPRRNLRGFSGNLNYQRLVPRGAVQQWEVGLNGSDLRTFQGGIFTQGGGAFSSITLRNGVDFDFGFSLEQFFDNDDRVFFFDFDRANGDPYRNFGVSAESGNLAGRDYLSVRPRFNVRPLPRLQLSGSYQSVRHFGTSDQTRLTANYDLNQSDSVSGRLIQQDRRTSWYLAFRRAGNKGAEYYVILGEPRVNLNRSFQASLILKAVFPFDWKL